jgi:hypothetical protein
MVRLLMRADVADVSIHSIRCPSTTDFPKSRDGRLRWFELDEVMPGVGTASWLAFACKCGLKCRGRTRFWLIPSLPTFGHSPL